MASRPPDRPGLRWRRASREDAAALAAHTRLVHEAETLEFLPGETFFSWLLEQPGFDPSQDDFLVAEERGRVVADTGAWLHSGDRGARCIVWTETSPGFEHLRPAMLEWAEARARERLADCDPSLPRVLRISVEEHRSTYRQAIEEAGFTEPRAFVEMARPLEHLPDPPPLPAGITVQLWDDRWEESVRSASNEAFADHWGSLPQSPEEFAGFVRLSPGFRPDLSFLAIEDDEVVSFCLCEVDDEDNEDRDTNDLYLQRIGTRRAHRGRRLASHLIVRSMHAAASTGVLDRAALEVDAVSHTGATRVYERLGFVETSRALTFVKTL